MLELNFDATLTNADFLAKVEQIRIAVRAVSSESEQLGQKISLGQLESLKELVNGVVKVRSEFQQLEFSFATLLQSKERADALMYQVAKTAVETPFNLTDLGNGAKSLITYGIQAEKVNDTLLQLGNIASGLEIPLEQLTTLYGTVMAQGQLYSQDLDRFTSSGVPMLQGLADVFGVTTNEVGEMVKAGKVGFPEVQTVIENLTSAGGRFYGTMEEQSNTISGKMANLTDIWDTMLNEIGKSQEGVINTSLDGTKYLMENYEQIGKVLLSLVETYGVYRAACVAHIVLTQSLATTQMELGLVMTKLKKAFLTLTASMNLNVWVVAATAIIGLGIALWNLRDSATAAEKAQRKFNDELDKVKEKENERKQKVEELMHVIRDETETQYAKIKAYEELRKYSPALTSAYKLEELATLDLAKSRKVLNAESEKMNYDTIISNINKYSTYVDKIRNAKAWPDLGSYQTIIEEEYGYGTLGGKLEQAEGDLRKWNKALDDYKRVKKEADERGYSIDERIQMAKNDLEEINTEYGRVHASMIAEQAKQKKEPFYVIPFSLQLNSDNLKSQLEKAKNKVKDLEELQEKEKAQKVESNQNSNSNLEIPDPVQELIEQQKRLQDIRNQSEAEREQAIKDLENRCALAEIDAKKEGGDKVLAQMKYNHKKEIDEFKKLKEDYLRNKIDAEKAKFEADPAKKGQTFDSSKISLNEKEKNIFSDMLMSTVEKQGNDISVYYKDLLSKYQSYAEKRLSAEEKFEKERKALKKAGASKETLAEHDYQRSEALNSIDNEFAMREDSFNAWSDSIANLSLEKLQTLLVQAEQELQRSEFLDPNDQKLAGQRAKVTSLKKAVNAESEKTKTSPDKRSTKEWQSLYQTLNRVEREFDEIGDAVGGTAGEIISAAGGIASSTLQMIDGIVMLANGSSTAMSSTSEAASTSIQTVEKASVILAIIGAALQIATKIASMFSADYTDYNKAKENYEDYVKVLDVVIDKQRELLESLTGKAAVDASQRALGLIEKQADAARLLGKERLNAGASAGSHSIGVRIRKGMSSEGWNEAKQALGSDFSKYGIGEGRMTGLFDLSVEQLTKLQMEAPAFWTKLDGDVREYLEQIIACNENTEEMKEILNESLTQVSFDDVYNNFLDALTDMDASSEDFAGNFEKYMQKAILNSMLVDKYKSRIDAWYAAFAEANDDDEGITIKEYQDLQSDWNDIVSDAIAERNDMKDMFGWTSEDSSSEESSTGGFQAMSQDTGDELNGRFTALQISNEEIKNSMQLALGNLSVLCTTASDGNLVLTEMRNLAIMSNSHLEDIARYTKPLLGIGEKLDKIEQNTKNL